MRRGDKEYNLNYSVFSGKRHVGAFATDARSLVLDHSVVLGRRRAHVEDDVDEQLEVEWRS